MSVDEMWRAVQDALLSGTRALVRDGERLNRNAPWKRIRALGLSPKRLPG